ncbi:ThiJ/PfpI family protein [Mycena capillaripes]|nr:ThiJ/PfpI family protein [Mycena capillaripes]
MSSDTKSKPVRIGVFIPGDTQLLDMACVDIFASMSKEYLSLLPMIPRHMVDIAPSVHISYITSKAVNPSMTIPATAGVKLQATHDISDPEVQPGTLDIVLVPGPDPSSSWEKPVLEFLAGHAKCETTDILSVCTGIFLCGAAGLLDGRTASGPRGLQDEIKKKYPAVNLIGTEYRWIQDGNLWSSGGITNGNDLVAAYARTGKYFPIAIAELGCKMTDVGDRAQIYSQGQAAFTLSMVWNLLRGWFTRRR